MDIDDVSDLNGGYKNYHLKKKRKRGIQNILSQFVSQCTLHGLHYLFEGRPLLQRFLWFMLQALMWGLFMWQTLTLVLEYFDYRVTSRIELVTDRESNFPAVTLCNFNKYRNSVLKNHTEYLNLIKEDNPLNGSLKKPINWTRYSNLNDLRIKELILKAGHQLKYDKRTNSGMLYRCTWKGKLCNHTHFTTKLTDMGVCYTFNSGENTTIRTVNGPGKYFGLHLRMSVEQDEYIPFLTFSAGLRVRIHDPGEPPLVSSLGFAVMPGSRVFASISRRRTVSLKYPYKTMCEDQTLPGIKSYTIPACHDNCKENYIAKQCDCQAFYMRDTRYNYTPCNVQQYFNCVMPAEEVFSSTEMKSCPCTEPCDTTKYIAYLSYGAFPSEESSRAYAQNKTAQMKYFEKNLLAIDIFFEELNYKVIKQVPAYSLQNLLGEIGGLLGLFLGASLLTVFEFGDVIIITALTRFGVYKHKNF